MPSRTEKQWQHHEAANDRDGPDQTEFVGDHREDEVAVRIGQVAELGVAAADPRPGPYLVRRGELHGSPAEAHPGYGGSGRAPDHAVQRRYHVNLRGG